jgi:hypothetical protein
MINQYLTNNRSNVAPQGKAYVDYVRNDDNTLDAYVNLTCSVHNNTRPFQIPVKSNSPEAEEFTIMECIKSHNRIHRCSLSVANFVWIQGVFV